MLLSGSSCSHPWLVIELPIWVEDWVHECCGADRRVGDQVEVDLTLEGEMHPAAGAEHVTVLDDHRVSVIGRVVGPSSIDDHERGVRIESGALRFGIIGETTADRVECVGRLVELRHGYPGWSTAGELTSIEWRPGVEVNRGGYTEIVGYGPGRALRSTEDWRGHGVESWAFALTLRVGS
jgi:hypothetical protein